MSTTALREDLLCSPGVLNVWYCGWNGFGLFFVAFAIALLATAWIYFDAQRHQREAVAWKIVSVLSAILIVPSFVVWLDPRLALNLQSAVEPLAYLGIAAGIMALIAFFAYTAGVGVGMGSYCPNCGQRLDPSWDRCPYCLPQPSPVPPVQPTTPWPEPAPVAPEPRPPAVTLPPQQAISLSPAGGFAAPVSEAPRADETIVEVRTPARLAWLVVLSGSRRGKEFRLGTETDIGQDATRNQVVIDDPKVSRDHARIRLEEDGFVLRDRASTNGTFVLDPGSGEWQEIQKHVLTDGDELRTGDTTFVFIEVAPK